MARLSVVESDCKAKYDKKTRLPADSSCLSAALAYAELGWHVLPLHWIKEDGACSCKKGGKCSTPGKHPLFHRGDLPNGANSATTDAGQIITWWLRWPKANVGIALWPSNLIVTDADPRNGGKESYEKLVEAYGPFEPTRRVLTGGGGWHDYNTRRPDYPALFGSEPNEYPGIEIKVRGLVVAPPSIHESGCRYRFAESSDLSEVILAPFPESLLSLLTTKNTEKKKAYRADIEFMRIGTRNKTLFRLGCHLRDRGISADYIAITLSSLNKTNTEEPLTEADIKKVIRQVLHYDRRPSWEPGPSPTAWKMYDRFMQHGDGFPVVASRHKLAAHLGVTERTISNANSSGVKWGIFSVARSGKQSSYTPHSKRARELRSETRVIGIEGTDQEEVTEEIVSRGEEGEGLTLFSPSEGFKGFKGVSNKNALARPHEHENRRINSGAAMQQR